MMRNERYPSDAAESRRQTSGPSSSHSPLVIDHLDEFTSALACACSTVADYVIATTDPAAEMADS